MKAVNFPIPPKILPIFPNLPVDGLDLSHRRCCDNPGSVTNCTHPSGRISMCWVTSPIRFSIAALHFRRFANSSILEREICIVIKIVFQKHYKVSTQIYSSNLPSKSILLEFFILCKCSLNIICSWIYEHSKIICLYQKFYLWGNPFKTLDHYSWYEFHHKVHWMKFIRLLIQAILLNDVCLYFNMTLAWNKGTEIYLQNEHINLWFFGRDFSMFNMFLSVRITLTYEDIWPAFWYLLLGLYK